MNNDFHLNNNSCNFYAILNENSFVSAPEIIEFGFEERQPYYL